ncbi:MAG: hypothetical protein HOE75_13445 [Chloroflexi bacterium]|jgi:hypothetical protein|nr:hypothetical protein [Chloroflexota bacterium]
MAKPVEMSPDYRNLIDELSQHGPGDGPRSSPTILLTVGSGFGARYLLGSGIARRLVERGASVIVLSPNAGDPEFESTFKRPGITVEKLNPDGWPGHARKSRLHRFLLHVRSLTLATSRKAATLDAHAASENHGPRKGLKNTLSTRFVHGLARLLRTSRTSRRFVIAMERRLVKANYHPHIFEQHDLDLVVTTDIGTTDAGNLMMREAKSQGVKGCSVILSWDNPTSKGIGVESPDAVIAWNDVMRTELTDYHRIPKERIFVEGIAHFDSYFDQEFSPGREEWLSRHQLDPSRRTIFLATASPSTYLYNVDLIRMILEGIESGRVSQPVQLLVRLHPVYSARIKVGGNRDREEMAALKKEFGDRLILNEPSMTDQPFGFIYDIEDQRTLAGILRHSDVMVNLFSTMMLEACIFDLPIINSALHTYRNTSIRNAALAEFTHIRPLLDMSAMDIAHSESDLFGQLNKYLAEPGFRAEERAEVRDLYGGPNKGRSVEAVSNRIMGLATEGRNIGPESISPGPSPGV